MYWRVPKSEGVQQQGRWSALLRSWRTCLSRWTRLRLTRRSVVFWHCHEPTGCSSYDAADLKQALRKGLPLATLDKNLIGAAGKADVPICLK